MNDFLPEPRPDPLARARDLGPAIAAAADAIERTQRIPELLLTQLHAARLCRMFLPRAVDGDEVEPSVYLRAVEEISRHDGSVGWNVFVANSSALIAPFLAPDAMRTIFADPRAIVAWGPPNASKAIAVPGGYCVTGRWDFASGCRQASWMGAHCQVVEPDGSLRLNAAGRPTMRTLLFPATQATLLNTWNVIGMRGTSSDSYTLDNVFVPEAFSATREDPTLRREPGRLYAFPMQGLYAVGVAGVAIGIARAMLDAYEALAMRKAPRNLGRLADNAVVQSSVAQMEARFGAARLSGRDAVGFLRDGRCRVGDRHPGACPGAAGLRARHPDRRVGGGLCLQGGGNRCDLPRLRVRAPLPRHPHAVAADPVAHRAF